MRTIEEAARIASGRVTVFGRDRVLLPEPNWHSTVESKARWPLEPWWRIDIRSENRLADIKWAWELGRHRHLVILARAVFLQPKRQFIASFLCAQLRSWIQQNPPERGVHWYSNLEIALRALAWLQVLALAGPALPADLKRDMGRLLHHSGRHLVADMAYTASSMRNNHLLGDSLGLIALGRAFPTHRPAGWWYALGERLFLRQLGRQVRGDGSMIEDSLSYHRFVLEMLAVRVLLGGEASLVRSQLVKAAQRLAKLGLRGEVVPQYGDWDEGRVLVATGDPADLVGSTRLALALGGTGAPPDWREEHDEVAWYAPEGVPLSVLPPEVGGHDVGGGMGRAEAGSFKVWLKAGTGASHGHADLLSTPIAARGQWVVGDPGTGTYNGRLEERNYFRSSAAHNVLRVAGADQLGPHRAFRWRHQANGKLGPPLRLATGTVMWGTHDAYARCDPPRRVVRAVFVHPEVVAVADWVSGPSGEAFQLSLPLVPRAIWTAGVITLPDGNRLRLVLPVEPTVVIGSDEPYDGWWSDTYGMTEPAAMLEVSGRIQGPVCWSVSSMQGPECQADGDTACVGDSRLTLEWEGERLRLRVSDGGVEQVGILPVQA